MNPLMEKTGQHERGPKLDTPLPLQRTAGSSKPAPKRFVKNQIPDSILNDDSLNAAISILPPNYNFEIHKCVWRVLSTGAKRVALQFPEGLLMYSLVISDILTSFADVTHCFILGDVTYGACCVDDLSAVALGADLLIHYGHSCLVPIEATKFLAFTSAKPELEKRGFRVLIPQSKPLSAGEVLGCTAPKISSIANANEYVAVFVADGRFHLEAFMIANPEIKAFRYDPYLGKLFLEEYDHKGMRETRRRAIEKAKGAKSWGIVLGTLGRQGNPRAEIALGEISGWWERDGCGSCGNGMSCRESKSCCDGNGIKDFHGDYPMDYYAQDGGEWNSSYMKKSARPVRRNIAAPSCNSAVI
ncbi:protein ECHIDNA-like [Hibiscus syriacus]|uniref:2-(3-amino-3-carboxypropyl)histidine synthase subunit 1 n=1 Tax=Hibiscus syriacus TaxID=106335 RepID=A0A6A2YD55_HIBSY|nr:protein ECHIDNA-like [Hibiscus syriacus]